MSDAESVRRRILTFAFVRTNVAQSMDPIAALRPLLVPIANEFADQAFEPDLLRTEMQRRYDLHLSRDVTDLFVRRLSSLHYLQSVSDGRRLIWKRQNQGEISIDATDDARKIDEILRHARTLHENRGDLVTGDFEEDSFLSGLMKLLLDTPQIQSAVDAIESANAGHDAQAKASRPKRILDPEHYFASEFVTWARTHEPTIFDWVADLAGAAMMSEALIEIRTPSPNQNVRAELEVYLDAPVAMELLGVSGRAAKEDAKAIVDGLRAHSATVAILSHSVEEVRRNLRAVLNKPPQERTGPTAQAMLHGEIREQDVQELANDVEYFLKASAVQVVDPKSLKHLSDGARFTVEDQHNFFAAIQSHYVHMEAAERDAASVAWVMRRRRGAETRDVLKAKFILLTRNDRLYRVASRFCRERAFAGEGVVGPTALVRDIAGILWVIGGSVERSTLSKRQLLLNCQRARASAPEIVGSMYATLQAVNPTSADLFWAAVQRPAYMSMTLDAVAAGGTPASASTADEVLDRIRSDLVAAERAKGREAIKRLADRYDQDANLREVVITTLERETNELRDANRRHVAAWLKVAKRERGLICRKAARSALLGIGVGIGLLVTFAAFSAYIGSDQITLNPALEAVIAAVAAVAFLFLSVSPILKAVVKRAERKASESYERALGEQIPEEHVEQVRGDNPALPNNLLGLIRLAFPRDR